MNLKRIILIYLTVFLFIACKDAVTETDSKQLIGSLWILESFEENNKIITHPIGQNYNILFSSDSTFSGQNDCNVIGGKYKITKNNQIEIVKIGTTFANCSEQSIFNEYYAALSEINIFNLVNNKLYLYYNENSKMIFIKE